MEPRLNEILARVFKISPQAISAESGPHTIPAWDSAGHMNLILELEEEFGVQFSDDEVVEMVSVEAIAGALAGHGVAR